MTAHWMEYCKEDADVYRFVKGCSDTAGGSAGSDYTGCDDQQEKQSNKGAGSADSD